jgi:hypothetical protein
VVVAGVSGRGRIAFDIRIGRGDVMAIGREMIVLRGGVRGGEGVRREVWGFKGGRDRDGGGGSMGVLRRGWRVVHRGEGGKGKSGGVGDMGGGRGVGVGACRGMGRGGGVRLGVR